MPHEKKSPWESTPQDLRKRKKVQITLSDEARAKLDRLAGPGMRSETIERLILKEPENKT